MNIVHNCDCMEFMKNIPDKYYQLSIVDPPYGIGAGCINFRNGTSTNDIGYKIKDWDTIPCKTYFNELFRVSINQIIWGGNYFVEYLFSSPAWIFWDKKTGNNSYADGELAWSNFKRPLKKYEYLWLGANAHNDTKRIHPTEKPVELYLWLLKNYAKSGDKIFDSHVGSGSSRCACYELGFDFEGCELDYDYWQAQEDRFKIFKAKVDNVYYLPDSENDLFRGQK
jgi:site-specific DNA-methyltransferase (adenine-specific)